METTVLKAKNSLSRLLHRAERGEEIVIRRGRNGKAFKLLPVARPGARPTGGHPVYAGKIKYRLADILASEWTDAP